MKQKWKTDKRGILWPVDSYLGAEMKMQGDWKGGIRYMFVNYKHFSVRSKHPGFACDPTGWKFYYPIQ